MPELPEVETCRRGIEPHICNQTISEVIIRQAKLRWPIPKTLNKIMQNQQVLQVTRRGKYLILRCSKGSLIIHLGMSGVIRILPKISAPTKHDHVDIIFATQQCLRFNDPRRFGSLLWTNQDPLTHPLLIDLGPEPLSTTFNADYLYQLSRKRKTTIKQFLMNSHNVAGIGNIYANEALFAAQIHPNSQVSRISLQRYQLLVTAIKSILKYAIKRGGTTIRDFMTHDGKPGYFKQELKVYGRKGEPCLLCNSILKELIMNQRSTVYCPSCQI